MTGTGTVRLPGSAGRTRGYRRVAGAGSGLIGGICCVGGAIAGAVGAGGLSCFTSWMNRYQMYVIIGSAAIMTAWLIHTTRGDRTRQRFAAAARQIWRQALVMGAVYTHTLLAAVAISGLVRGM